MDKKVLRSCYLEKRKKLGLNEKVVLEESIQQLLFESFNFNNKIVSCFLPISEKHEIDTWPIVSKIIDVGGAVALTKWNVETNELAHVLYSMDLEIEINAFGIPEPIGRNFIESKQIDIVIVPLLIADQKGNRVGYGKGVYDRFLSNCPASTKFIGISLFELIDEISDVDLHDVSLHYCVTPSKIYMFEK